MLAFFIIFVTAALASLALTPLVIRAAVAWGMYDAPHGDRRVHTEPLPRLGGVAVAGGVFVGLLALPAVGLPQGPPGLLFGVVFGGGIVFATGLIDDIRGLRPGVKLAAQVIAALIAYSYGFQLDALRIGSLEVQTVWLSLPLTLLWITGVTNAFNLIDGLDGLATGIAVVALGATLTIALALGNLEAIALAVALLGSLLAFLRFNFSPARIFLGDSGSLFVGFMLAVLSVSGSQTHGGSAAVLVLVPLFALAIPLLDTLLAMLRRWLRGVPLSQADGRHIHHRLLVVGLSHRQAVTVLYLMASLLAVLGLSLVFAPPPATISIAAAGGGVVLLALLYELRRLQYHEFLEAGSVLVGGVGRLRRAIRDQIYAQDLHQILKYANSLEEINAVVEDNAGTFGFLHMEVCRESSTVTRPLVLFNGHVVRAWKLDYPVASHDFVEGDDYVLRIWCNPRNGEGPYGAERVAFILAPVIEAWITCNGVTENGARLARSEAEGDGDQAPVAALGDVRDRVRSAPRMEIGIRPGA